MFTRDPLFTRGLEGGEEVGEAAGDETGHRGRGLRRTVKSYGRERGR